MDRLGRRARAWVEAIESDEGRAFRAELVVAGSYGFAVIVPWLVSLSVIFGSAEVLGMMFEAAPWAIGIAIPAWLIRDRFMRGWDSVVAKKRE